MVGKRGCILGFVALAATIASVISGAGTFRVAAARAAPADWLASEHQAAGPTTRRTVGIVQPTTTDRGAATATSIEPRGKKVWVAGGELAGVARGLPNDACADAVVVSDGVTPFSTVGATTDGDPFPGHPSCDFANDDQINQDVWFDYTASCTGILTVSTCDDATFDTKIAVYGGINCPAMTEIACNDDGCPYHKSAVDLTVVAGNRYKIRVGGYMEQNGTGNLTVTCVDAGSCSGAQGDCCAPAGNDSPGCNDIACCMTVCDAGSSCCSIEWTDTCAVLAADLCEVCGGGGPCREGAGDCCHPAGNGTPGCEDPDCCEAVCTEDSFCCDTHWDNLCATQAANLCPLCRGGGGNDSCEDALPISDGQTSYNTIGATTDGPPHAACVGGGDEQIQADIWYDYTATFTGDLEVSTCGTAGYDTKLAIYEGCDCPVTDARLLACNDDAAGCLDHTSEVMAPVAQDACYKIRIGGYQGATGIGTVILSEAPEPCELQCPQGATFEPEACGDSVNDGCNLVPEFFTPITCGETVCGTAWAQSGTRDTDWYELVVTEQTIVTWTVRPEFPAFIGFVETVTPGSGNCDDVTEFLSPFASGGDCAPLVVSQSVTPGTYWLFVAPFDFDGLQCGSPIGNDYVAEVACGRDNCTDALMIGDGVTPFDTSLATTDGPPHAECESYGNYQINNDIWYDHVATCTGELTVSLCGTEFDTKLAIYAGTGCPVSDPMACNDDHEPCGLQSELTAAVTQGAAYKIRIGSFSQGVTGAGFVTIDCAAMESCPNGTVNFIDPPDGVVDARQPHPVGSATPLQGIDTIVATAPAGSAARCWFLCETEERNLGSNGVAEVTDNGDGTFTITLARPITPGALTMLTYAPDGPAAPTTGNFIAHPANVNGDSGASPLDILKEIDCVNGVEPDTSCPFGLYSCDANHSAECNSADILRVIDLLNGADTFEMWNGTARPANEGPCP